jgi:hypothetical protein
MARLMVLAYSKQDQTLARGLETFPIVELNISTIVLSGLGLLTVFKLGILGPTTRMTPLTYVAALLCIALLVSGSLLYAVNAVGMSRDNSLVTWVGLSLAALMSLFLTIEQAWLAALYGNGGKR